MPRRVYSARSNKLDCVVLLLALLLCCAYGGVRIAHSRKTRKMVHTPMLFVSANGRILSGGGLAAMVVGYGGTWWLFSLARQVRIRWVLLLPLLGSSVERGGCWESRLRRVFRRVLRMIQGFCG